MTDGYYTMALNPDTGEIGRRLMTDEELVDLFGSSDPATIEADRVAAAEAAVAATVVEPTPLERFAEQLAAMPADQVVTASDLLAILRPADPVTEAPSA